MKGGTLRALLCVCLTLGITVAFGQKLVSATDNGTIKARDVQAKYKKYFVNATPVDPVDIRLIKVRYLQGQDDKASDVVSGLLAVPVNGAPKGIVIYFHGTIANRESVPSRYRGGDHDSETAGPVLAFATSGYAVMMPDYPGLGDGKGVHPYYNMAKNARSGLEMLDPAWFSAEKFKLKMGTNYFISGYSQGGAVAMWATRMMEWSADESMRTVRSAPMSGPYDLSRTQARFIFEKSNNPVAVGSRAYLAAYLARSLKHNGVKIRYNDYFVPSFANYIDKVFTQNLSDENTVRKLFGKAAQLGSTRGLDRITLPKFRKAIRDHDVKDPVVRELASQDCIDWELGTETYLVCVEKDQIVSSENTKMAVRALRATGAGPERLRYHSLKGAALNHVTGMAPALLLARKFFDHGFTAVPGDR